MGKSVGADGVCVYTGLWWKFALPGVVIPAHLAVVAGACLLAARRTVHPLRDVGAGLAAGWIVWTLFEYAFHRWLLHHVRRPLLRRVFWDALHREHHGYRQMHDPDHHAVHLAITLPIALLVVGTVAATTPSALGLAAAAGWLLGYCTYEALHWLFHSRESATGLASVRPFRGLWEAHRLHHLQRADRNYGFVTQFWDRGFGSALRSTR